jgi:CubicO group peptidase (beta-lactamase class C family)
MKASHLFLLAASLLLFSCTVQEEHITEQFLFATPEKSGMSSDSLNMIESMVMEFVNAKKYPGAVTLIAKSGKIIYESEVGWSDSARTIPYRKNHLFRMASMTKPLVSVATMQLVEQGKIQLDDPVSKYIPSFDSMEVLLDYNPVDTSWTSVPAKTEPTVRQLLTHTAGVPYGFMNPSVNGAILAKYSIPDLSTHRDWTIEQTMTRIGNLPLMHQPGEKWMYGLNTDVLGRVVEVASGMELDDYIREKITIPIGAETLDFFFNDSSASNNLTKVFISDTNGQFAPMPIFEPFYIPNYPVEGAKTYHSGGSGMTGMARDYFLFCQAMLNDGKLGDIQLLKAETAQLMHQDQIDTISFPWGPSRFGFGFDIATADHPNRPEGTYSWGGAFSTIFWIDPTNELIVIQLRQVLSSPHNEDINSRLEKIVYSALLKE